MMKMEKDEQHAFRVGSVKEKDRSSKAVSICVSEGFERFSYLTQAYNYASVDGCAVGGQDCYCHRT